MHLALAGFCPDDAERLIARYIQVYNEQRLHSAIGYVTPPDMLEGRQPAIHAARDQKLKLARERRQQAAKLPGGHDGVGLKQPGRIPNHYRPLNTKSNTSDR